MIVYKLGFSTKTRANKNPAEAGFLIEVPGTGIEPVQP